jgi:DUF1680 family protein
MQLPDNAALRRQWSPGDVIELELAMDVVFLQAHPLVEEARKQVSVMRGPIVYCLESPDLPEGVRVDDVAIIAEANWTPRCDEDLLGCVKVLEGEARVFQPRDWTDRLYQRWAPEKDRRIDVTSIPITRGPIAASHR